MSEWTVRFDRTVDIDSWAEDKPVKNLAGLHDWLADRRENGPSVDAWLVELEEGYRYRYWLIEANITVEFIAVTYGQWMLVTKLD